jgi:hypothetical protein
MIWVFGDSHAGKFGGDERFKLVGPPAPTAYGLASEKARSESLFMLQMMLHFAEEGDLILFVLGEIDCRVHIYRQSVITGRETNHIIFDAVERYIRVVKDVRDHNPVDVAVLDVPPAVKQPNVYMVDHYGTRDQRAEIARRWNVVLKDYCEKNDICFVKLYPYITDERGWLKEEYSEDEVHISSIVVPFVMDELRKCYPHL